MTQEQAHDKGFPLRPAGSPRLLDGSVPMCCRLSPRKAPRLLPLISSPRETGFITPGRLATFPSREGDRSGLASQRFASRIAPSHA